MRTTCRGEPLTLLPLPGRATHGRSYLLKAADATWEDGIVALEAGTWLVISSSASLVAPTRPRFANAGSGIGAMTRLLDSHPAIFAPDTSESESRQHLRSSYEDASFPFFLPTMHPRV